MRAFARMRDSNPRLLFSRDNRRSSGSGELTLCTDTPPCQEVQYTLLHFLRNPYTLPSMDNEQAIFDYRTWKQETAGLPMDDVPDDVVLEMSKMDQTYTTRHDTRSYRDRVMSLDRPFIETSMDDDIQALVIRVGARLCREFVSRIPRRDLAVARGRDLRSDLYEEAFRAFWEENFPERMLKRDEALMLGGPDGGRIVQVSNPPNPFIEIPEPDVAPIAQWSSSSQSYRGNVRTAVYRFIPFESRHAFTGLYVSSDLLPSDLTRGINHSEEQGR